MLTYMDKSLLRPAVITDENQDKLQEAIWLDLLFPTKEEENMIDSFLGFTIPTRAEMIEIELSSRLYSENDVLFMTSAMIANSDSADPVLDPVTFILTKQQLITLRYVEPQSFKLFTSHVKKLTATQRDAITLLIELLEATVDRLADILELVVHRVDTYSKTIFRPRDNTSEKRDYQQLMQQLGANGDLTTKGQESLVTFNRLIAFLIQSKGSQLDTEKQTRLSALSKDIMSLTDHSHFLATKVNFLLDATLGMVSIEQNNIIKIFSVAAVIFLPPTLIASIYGMNFHAMPELTWQYGYLCAVGLMIAAAWLPYKYFKYKKWL
ncbi:MAG: magnesium transporter CorA family protein [Legionellaceae bacterium]|nr:magnesium transporter CorA family protein [Legionellaceae bacterium]